MNENLKVLKVGKGGKKQGVVGLQVMLQGREFFFNYSTVMSPRKIDLDLLKDFRNEVVDKLEQLNLLLGELKE